MIATVDVNTKAVCVCWYVGMLDVRAENVQMTRQHTRAKALARAHSYSHTYAGKHSERNTHTHTHMQCDRCVVEQAPEEAERHTRRQRRRRRVAGIGQTTHTHTHRLERTVSRVLPSCRLVNRSSVGPYSDKIVSNGPFVTLVHQ